MSDVAMDTVAAPKSTTSGDWVPSQYRNQPHIDLRASKTGPKGYKVKGKRKLEELVLLGHGDLPDAEEQPEVMDVDEPSTSEPSTKRQKAEDSTYRPVTGRVPWKLAQPRAAKIMKAQLGITWEKKMADKAIKKQFTDLKRAAEDAQKATRKAAALKKKASIERKKANQLKSQVVQKISKSATIKKMMKSKKQRKLLKTADTN